MSRAKLPFLNTLGMTYCTHTPARKFYLWHWHIRSKYHLNFIKKSRYTDTFLVWISHAYYDPSYSLLSCPSTKICSNQASGISNRGLSLSLNHCVIFSQSNFTLNLKSNGLSTVIDIYSINQQMRKGLGKHENDPESTKCRQCMRPALQKHGLLNPNLFIKHSKNSCFSQVKIFSGSSFQACCFIYRLSLLLWV